MGIVHAAATVNAEATLNTVAAAALTQNHRRFSAVACRTFKAIPNSSRPAPPLSLSTKKKRTNRVLLL